MHTVHYNVDIITVQSMIHLMLKFSEVKFGQVHQFLPMYMRIKDKQKILIENTI